MAGIKPTFKELFMFSIRRLVTIQLVICIAMASLNIYGKDLEPYSDIETTDKWISSLFSYPKAASGTLIVGRFSDRMYYLTEQISWKSDEDGESGLSVTVPKGFVTDFASIPKVFWSLLGPDESYVYAAVIHDYLYWEQKVDRATADDVLYKVMKEFKVPAIQVTAIYTGVRAGGEFAWRQNDELKKNGEKRVLKTFPTDPHVRWIDWKNEKNVF